MQGVQLVMSFTANLEMVHSSGEGCKTRHLKKIEKRTVQRKSVQDSDCKVLVLLLNQTIVFLNSMLQKVQGSIPGEAPFLLFLF